MKGVASEQNEYDVRVDSDPVSNGSLVEIRRDCRSLDGMERLSAAGWTARDPRKPSSMDVQRFEMGSVRGHSGGRVPILACRQLPLVKILPSQLGLRMILWDPE